MSGRRRLPALLALALAGALLGPAGCDGGGSGGATLTVLAAASLTDAFEEAGEAFAAGQPGVGAVTLAFAGSQQHARALTEGAAADVFASADATRMALVAEAGLVDGEPLVFARNGLAIAVERGNPLGIAGLADLDGVTLVLPAEQVPAGAYARQALAAAGVAAAPSSLEPSVRAALSKVELGEADAAIVFASDVAGSERADAVTLPVEHDVEAAYPIAVLAGAAEPEAARAFVAFVRGPAGQRILEAHGFRRA